MGCLRSSFRRFFALGLCGESCQIESAIRCQKPAVWGAGCGPLCPEVGSEESVPGTASRPVASVLSLVSLHQLVWPSHWRCPFSLGLRAGFPASEAASSLQVWQSAVATPRLRSPVCLCVCGGGHPAWGPGHPKVRKWQGNRGVMGSPSARCSPTIPTCSEPPGPSTLPLAPGPSQGSALCLEGPFRSSFPAGSLQPHLRGPLPQARPEPAGRQTSRSAGPASRPLGSALTPLGGGSTAPA